MQNNEFIRYEMPIAKWMSKQILNKSRVKNTRNTLDDYSRCTDLLVKDSDDNIYPVALRLRRTCRWRQLTLRTVQEGNGRTEIDKLLDSGVQYYYLGWYLYGSASFYNATECDLGDWHMIIIEFTNRTREAIKRHSEDTTKMNKQGNSGFISIPLNELDVIWSNFNYEKWS